MGIWIHSQTFSGDDIIKYISPHDLTFGEGEDEFL